MFAKILLVGIGGGLGSALRFVTSHYLDRMHNLSFPISIFTVNILGCLIIGALLALTEKHLGDNVRLFLIPGFCGGYTTFSTFAYENLTLIQNGNILLAILYITLSIILGLLAVWGGFSLMSLIIK